MGASPGATRSAAAALMAWLSCSVGGAVLGPARAQSVAEAPLRTAAVEPLKTDPLIPEAAKADPARSDSAKTDPAEDAAKAATTSGAPPEPDFKPPPPEEPVAAAPMVPAAPRPPSDPLGAAVFARLADSAPLLPRLPTKQREAMQAVYALGDFKPLWIAERQLTPAAKSAIERLRAAAEDGLDPAAYPVPALGVLSRADTEAELAEADLKLSAAILLYARDARGGRISPSGIARLITPHLDLPAADALLPEIAAAGDGAGRTLQAYNPRSPGYLALKSRLASMRGDAPRGTPSVKVPAGPVLKVGMSDPRVPLLRRHFGLAERAAGTLDRPPGEPEAYDRDVAEAVSRFQRSRGLPDTGSLTGATLAALDGPARPAKPSGNEADLLVNMERWRWLPSDLGADYVLVNVPEFRLKVVRGGSVRDETRVIVGKPDSPTPLFSGLMEYAVVNPSWYVPPSILKTMLASGRTAGFEVVRRGNVVSLRQPPGERNALGFIKFMFPNQHSVYLHDTPNRSLFGASNRALSHGCVRVDDPFRFADAVLPDWTSERLKKLIGKGERTIRLAEKLPVHLAYFTAEVDAFGTYRTLPDLYGYDAPMKAALGLSSRSDAMARAPAGQKRKVADTPAAASPSREAVRRPTVRRIRREAVDPFDQPRYWQPDVARRDYGGYW